MTLIVTGLEADWFGLLTFAKTFTAVITGHATTVFTLSQRYRPPTVPRREIERRTSRRFCEHS